MTQDEKLDLVVKFIKKYGPDACTDPADKLRGMLDWFVKYNYILLIWNKQDLVGVFVGYPIKNLEEVNAGLSPAVDEQGKYFYPLIAVIHPDWQDSGLFQAAVEYVHQHWPTVEYVYFQWGAKNDAPTIFPIDKYQRKHEEMKT